MPTEHTVLINTGVYVLCHHRRHKIEYMALIMMLAGTQYEFAKNKCWQVYIKLDLIDADARARERETCLERYLDVVLLDTCCVFKWRTGMYGGGGTV